jgi:hypothetical protein
LDQRYSDPAAVATEEDETRRVLESAEVFWISTVWSDGTPFRAEALRARRAAIGRPPRIRRQAVPAVTLA